MNAHVNGQGRNGVRGSRGEGGLQRAMVRALVLAQVIAPVAARAQVVAVPGANGPGVVQTANGLQQVNITAPTAAGVSKNVYSQFDVPRQGVILNNSSTLVNTQQAGYVNGNPNLARDQAARVILNQVNSQSPSQLRGYLEVAGKAAQVVVANSAGILVDGGGFINTTRGVLTTGTPIMGSDGSLTGYQVNGGRLVIQGDGLNAQNVDQVDLISRAVQVNAALHAKQLNVVTGTNRVDHERLSVQKTAADADAPDVALDVGQLGGMYAQRIFLQGTENGVGVSNRGVIAAQAGDLTLTTEGKLVNAGQTLASGAMTMAARALDNTGGTLVAERLDVTLDGALVNRQGSISAAASTITAAALDNDHGRLHADALSLTVSGDASNRSGEIKQFGASDQTIKVGGALDNTGGTMATNAGSLALDVGQMTNDSGTVSHLGDGQFALTSSGVISNRNGLVGTLGVLRTTAAWLNNTGGELSAADALHVSTAGDLVNREGGVVFGAKGLTVSAGGDIDNTSGSMQSTGDVRVSASGALTNSGGRVSANGAHDRLTVSAQTIDNASGQIANAGDGDTEVVATTTVDNTGGTLGGNGRLSIDAASVANVAGGKVVGGGDVALGIRDALDNTGGQVFGGASLTMTQGGARVTNTDGVMESRGDVAMQLASLDNTRGIVRSNRDVSVGGAMTGAGQMTAGRDLTVAASGDYVNASMNRLRADGALTVTSTGRFVNDGVLEAPGTLNVRAVQIVNNAGGLINAATTQLSADDRLSNEGNIGGDTVRLKANTFNNVYGVLGNDVQVDAADVDNAGPSAIVGATRRLAVYASNAVVNRDGALLYSMGDIEIARDGVRDATGMLANQSSQLTNSSASIVADGNLDIAASVVDNKRTSIVTQAGTPQSETKTFGLWTAGLIGGDETLWHDSKTFPEWKWNAGHAPISSMLLERLALPVTVELPKSEVTNLDMAAKTFSLTRPIIETYSDATTQGQGPCDDHGNCADGIKTREVATQAVQYFNGIVDTGSTYRITFWPDWNPSTMIRPDEAISRGDLGIDQRDYNELKRVVTTTRTRDELVSASAEGKLQAQGTIRINADGGEIRNQSSLMTAGGDLIRRAQGGAVRDEGIALQERVEQSQVSTFYWHQKSGGDSEQLDVAYPVMPLPPTTVASLPAIAVGNQTVETSGQTITVSSVDRNGNTVGSTGVTGGNGSGSALITLPGGIPGLTLPGSPLYQLRPAPEQTYLVATDPRFTQYGKFISSDYMLDALGLDPQKTQKRLGDGFYETQLVRDQITALTGRTLLGGNADYLAQYTALLGNGVAYGKQFDLSVGVGLSDVQMQQLTTDLVWLVSQDITLPDGSVQSVLVPKVYLAQANTVDLASTGALVGGGSVKLVATGDVQNSGRIVSDTATTVLGDAIVNFGSVGSRGTTALTSLGDIRNTGGRIDGQDVVVRAGRDLINESTTLTQTEGTDTDGFASRASATSIGSVGLISASNSATLVANRDVTLNAGAIASDGSVTVAAGRDIQLNTLAVGQSQTVGTRDGKNGGSDVVTQHVWSAISSGGNLTTVSGRDTTLNAATLSAGENVTVIAGNDVSVNAAKDSYTHDARSHGGTLKFVDSTLDESVRGTQVVAGNNVIVGAGQTAVAGELLGAHAVTPVAQTSGTGNLTILGSTVASHGAGTAALAATGDVTIGSVSETHDSYRWQHNSSSGFLSKSEETSEMRSHQTVAVGSTVSADTVGATAGRDLSVIGSTMVGTQDVALQAGRDLRIEASENASESSSFHEKKHSGLGSSGGVGISYGKNEEQHRTNDSSVTHTGSLVGSLDGNVSLVAGRDLSVRGSDVMAGGDVTGIGQNVSIESVVNRVHHDEAHEYKSSGFTLALKSPVIDAVQNVTSQVNAAVDSGGDARVSALRGYAAASGAYGAVGEAGKLLDTLDAGKTPEAKVELSWGSSSSKSTSSLDSTQNVASQIKAGGTAAFIATGDAASGKGNVNVIGSTIDAKDVLLQATNQVNLRHSTDTESTRSENESKSGSVGVSYGTGGFGISASMSKANGDANSDSAFQNNTHINASHTAVIVSGGDTNVVGANVNADKVIARVGGDLNIASVQDTSESSAHQQSMSGGLNLSQGGASGSFSYSRGNASANYAGVVEQSGIQAGAGGFDVNVAGNTDLKGAYIASTAEASKNQLTTGTLTFSDIENHSEYSANSFGFGGGFSIANGGTETKKTGPKSGTNKGGISPMLPQSESGNERATTYSGVSEGTITLTDGANQKQDLASLKRETMDLNGTVSRTPDLQELLNDQSRLMSAATAAGEAVARDIGTYASKKEDEARKLAEKTTDPELKAQYEQEAENWKEGGDYRALMHAAGGAIVAGLGGGNALGGALGAGATSKLGDTLNKLSADIQNSRPTGNADVDEALAQIVATGIGTAVGAAAGGSSGAFTGFNTDRYNRQLHASEEEKLKALQRGKTPEEQYRYAAALCADARCADGIPDSDPNRAVLLKMQTEGEGFTAEREMLKRAGVFEGYSRSDRINDAYDRYQVGSRALGAFQGVTSAAIGVGALGVGCPTVAACGAAAAVAVSALDYSKAGFTRAVTGGAASTYGEQALQSLGIGPEAAAVIYPAFGLGLGGTLAIGRKVMTMPGTPIFSAKGALGSQALAGPVGTGSISAGINATVQYAQNGEINPVNVIGAFVAGTAGHGRGIFQNAAISAGNGTATTAINNILDKKNDSLIGAGVEGGLFGLFGYGAGKVMGNTIYNATKPTIDNSVRWAGSGNWSGGGHNLFMPNNAAAIGATSFSGTAQESAQSIYEFIRNNRKLQ